MSASSAQINSRTAYSVHRMSLLSAITISSWTTTAANYALTDLRVPLPVTAHTHSHAQKPITWRAKKDHNNATLVKTNMAKVLGPARSMKYLFAT